MFHNCRPSLMMQVTMASSSVLLGATEAVMREGDTADHLYVLEKGCQEVRTVGACTHVPRADIIMLL